MIFDFSATMPNPAQQSPKTTTSARQQKLIVVLEGATLETIRLKSFKSKSSSDAVYQLINCDDHAQKLKSTGRDISEMRPDITHQCLLTLLDSPLNKAGKLQVFIHTSKGVLIQVHPHTRIPRTYKRFAGLMGISVIMSSSYQVLIFVHVVVQLLHKLVIRSTNGSEKLLQVIKNPITDHLPPNCLKIACTPDAPVARMSQYVPSLPKDQAVCFVIGAYAHGPEDFASWCDEKVSVSEFALSASVTCAKICCAYEDMWNIV